MLRARSRWQSEERSVRIKEADRSLHVSLSNSEPAPCRCDPAVTASAGREAAKVTGDSLEQTSRNRRPSGADRRTPKCVQTQQVPTPSASSPSAGPERPSRSLSCSDPVSGSGDFGVELNPSTPDDMAEEDAKMTKPPSSFMPELRNEPLAEVSYRFMFPGPGDFQCVYTGLVFVMAQKAEMCYRTVMWDESLLQPAGKVAAGPLFKIQCPEDAVCQLHLTHCEIKDAAFTENLLSVANITDEGMAILKPLKITDTHVIVEVPQPSAFGIVRNFEVSWRIFSTPKPVRGQVLLFLQPANPVTERQNLNLVLLSSNVPLEEVRRRHAISRYISAPINCRLIVERNYTIHCPTAYKIQPKKAEFDLEFGPNYHPTFEVRLETSQEQVTITLRDQTDTDVWEQDIDLTDFRKSSASVQNLSK